MGEQKSEKSYQVRLKPHNPRKGYNLRRYVVFGMRFDVDRGWYRVPEYIVRYTDESDEAQEVNLIEYLRLVRNDAENPDSPLAFDVCTPEEATALQAAEKAAKEAAVAKAENPNPIDMVTSEKIKASAGIPGKPKRGRGRPPKAKAAVDTDAE